LNGSSGRNIATTASDTTSWHRYGIDWTANQITYYQDGKVVGTACPTTQLDCASAQWYQNANLGMRMDYVMDPNWLANTSYNSTPTDPVVGTQPEMQVDYARYYTTMPSNMPTGSNDPYAQ
jgi:beta-glucanase (GH16 family)